MQKLTTIAELQERLNFFDSNFKVAFDPWDGNSRNVLLVFNEQGEIIDRILIKEWN